MLSNKLFLECFQVVPCFGPVDLSDGSNNGDWIDLRDTDGVVFIFQSQVGTAGQDPSVFFELAKGNTGTDAKEIDLQALGRIHKKQAAANLNAVERWTLADAGIVSAGANTGRWTDGAAAEQVLLLVVDFNIEDLIGDANPDFTHIRIRVPDVGAGEQIGSAIAIVKTRQQRDPTMAVSSIG